jgi:uncharacterized protein (DUF1330 family)
MMAAHIVIDRLSVTDREAFDAYGEPANAAVERYGGRYVLPREPEVEALEGNWRPNCLVVIEFEDADRARQWWDSPEYAGARAIHHRATISNIILVEGSRDSRTTGAASAAVSEQSSRPPARGR